jgi:hypothetical protein
MVMDPDNKDGNLRSSQMPQTRSALDKRVDTELPDLGKRGWLGSILNPDNPLDAGSLACDGSSSLGSPSGSPPSLPTASGAISLISFTVHRVGAAGTQLLAGASQNFS